ncbi:MAG: FHA domain-containing protein [Solirubrobacteraceae bacterium]
MSSADAQIGALRPDTIRLSGRDTMIGAGGVLIGRGEDCDIQLESKRASRHHARIFVDGTGCWVEDLGSTNGTLVAGERVQGGRRALHNGDHVVIGEFDLMVLAGERTSYQPNASASAVAGPPSEITPVDLTDKPLTIGRDPSNVLVLDDPNVSRFHAVVNRTPQGVAVLRDLSSRNGTRVAGELVSRVTLEPGVEIAVGAYRLTFTGTALIPRDDRGALRLESRGVTMRVGDRTLLAPTTLTVEPGELVAIIGESGAGKTTLLKALAGITEPTAGRVLVNGEPVHTRLTDIGYVPQDDIVHRLLTVREALRYAAALRLPPDTSQQEIEAAVTRVLTELDLEPHAETLVRDVSGGQRKRVGVAVELLSRPGILFLDEPATGLDPGLEKRLMQLLHQLSRDSRPIVTITHSTKQLHLCDKLAVMARGGALVFYGEPTAALRFFEVPEYDDIYQALDEHPVDHWTRARPDDTEAHAAVSAASAQASAAPARSVFTRPSRQRQPPVLPQAMVLARRYKTLLLRDRRNLAILLGQVPVLAVLIAIGFNARVFAPDGSLINAPTVLFVTTITAMWLGSIAAAREIVKERSVFLRERAVGVSVNAYLISKAIVLFTLSAVQIAILAAVLFAMRPLFAPTSVYTQVIVILMLTGFAAVGMGLLASTLARSEDQSTSFIPLILIPQLLFGGSLIPLAGKSLGIKVLAGLMVSRWAFAGLGSALHLDDSPYIASRYPGFFTHSPWLMALIVAIFAAIFLAAVWARLSTHRD